ncbi:MAG: OadG family protein [Desulforegulaceae bacterium]|nr:OadG family protein [Desulforegulaceae bacterium]
MFNLELISELNGWSFAGTGMLIVFGSLAGLAFIISCLHKMLELYDKCVFFIKTWKTRFFRFFAEGLKNKLKISSGLKEYAVKLRAITALIGEPFHLSDLIRNAEKRGLNSPPPGFIVEELLKANFIISDDSKKFRWNQRLCEIVL